MPPTYNQRIPELADAIVAYASALRAGDSSKSEQYVSEAALPAHRAIAAEVARKGPFESYQDLALAKIGFQFMSKLRFENLHGKVLILVRWRKEPDGKWQIASAEDISSKRSPWSDIPTLQQARSGNGNA